MRHVTFRLHDCLLPVRWSVIGYAHELGSSSALDLMVGDSGLDHDSDSSGGKEE
jgi:hypothetical protein